MLIPLIFPPGLYRNGTAYQSKGRWYDCNLVRWYQRTIQAVGGWISKTTDTLSGMARAITSWHDNSAQTWIAVGTNTNLYAMTRGGAVSDITPTDFTTGDADATAAGGWGSGYWGMGTWGTPRPDDSTITEASMWSLDQFGERLVGVMAKSGVIYEWALNTGTPAAAVSNAPSAVAVMTTNEGMLAALGADNVPRRIKWSEQEDNTTWLADATNQAGDEDLSTNGKLLQGLRVLGGHLLFTDVDLWTMTFTADSDVYAFKNVGQGCGAISRNCAITLDAQAVWMGQSSFWLYNGYVQPLPCDVWDFVFGDINTQQISKVTCELDSAFGEVRWNYPSSGSTEIDRCVIWNFRENHWRVEYVARLCGVDRGVTQNPLRVDALGNIYEHEVGNDYDDSMPYLESGPIEFEEGDNVIYANFLLPDDKTLGDVTATFFVRFEPDGEEMTFGPYTLSKKTDFRFSGRQIRFRIDGARNTSWRVGGPRLDITVGGAR